MFKLVLVGAALLAGSGSTAVTPHQAVRAIKTDGRFLPTSQVTCAADGRAQLCDVSDATEYTDQVVGPARIVGTTVVRVSRRQRGYRVRIVVPDRFDIYAN